MRIEDFLNQNYTTKRLAGYQKQPEAATFSLNQDKQAADKVTISPEAKEAQQQGGGYFTNSVMEPNEARLAFKAYMDKVTGREPSPPKTPEEKLKELAEKIKKLQGELSDVMADESLADSVKSDRINTLTAQLNEAYAQMSEISKEMGGGGSGGEAAEA